MPLPLAPLLGIALRYGAAASLAFAVARATGPARRDQGAEDAHDRVAEGLTMARDDRQVNATARWRRVFRSNATGRAVEVDASLLGRLKIRDVP